MVLVASIILSMVATVVAQNGATDTSFIRSLGGAKEDVCHFPPGNVSNFKTLSVGEPAVAKHLEHGDWLGSCEDNCVDICTSEESPIFGTGLPIEDCLESCGITGGLAIVVTENTEDLSVISCDATTVEIQGPRAEEVSEGKFLIYLEGNLATCNTRCSPLFRMVESVAEEGGTKILTTRFATAAEIVGEDTVREVEGFDESPLEPLAGCPHSGAGSRKLHTEISPEEISFFQESANTHRQLQGTCRSNWLLKNGDGRCRFTNCFVGEDGDPDNCFKCTTNCDNGCGPSGGPSFDGNLYLFDFGRACCNHDHCWSSSTFSREACDAVFYDQMREECPPLIVSVFALIVGLPTGVNAILASCDVLAAAFYLAVSKTDKSDTAYADAQAKQKKYEEEEDVCIAQCPSTQRSGGQGTTTLTVDLLQDSGTFQVTYQMYQVPDRLFIDYEGQRIFDTGGLVSGSRSVSVDYSGTSTVVQVTMDAPRSGTAWDVTVDCPL